MHSKTFIKYLDESFKVSQNASQELCTKYIEEITGHVEIAQKIFVLTHDAVTITGQSKSTQNGGASQHTQHAVNAFSGNNIIKIITVREIVINTKVLKEKFLMLPLYLQTLQSVATAALMAGCTRCTRQFCNAFH